jgi:membrane protease subunit (stomatin/prohibitin family)
MNDARHDDPGAWQFVDPSDVITWTAAQPPRLVEGPLDLASFDGQMLVLDLDAGQIAYREAEGCLRQVFLDGVHRLRVGEGAGQVSTRSRLFFLRTDQPVTWRWQGRDALVLEADGPDGYHLPLRGTCSLGLADPVRFYQTVVHGLASLDLQDLTRVLDALVRAQLAAHLQPLVQRGRSDLMQAQIRLSQLGADDLSDDLADLGLVCLHLIACTPVDSEDPTGDARELEATSVVAPASYDDVF